MSSRFTKPSFHDKIIAYSQQACGVKTKGKSDCKQENRHKFNVLLYNYSIANLPLGFMTINLEKFIFRKKQTKTKQKILK